MPLLLLRQALSVMIRLLEGLQRNEKDTTGMLRKSFTSCELVRFLQLPLLPLTFLFLPSHSRGCSTRRTMTSHGLLLQNEWPKRPFHCDSRPQEALAPLPAVAVVLRAPLSSASASDTLFGPGFRCARLKSPSDGSISTTPSVRKASLLRRFSSWSLPKALKDPRACFLCSKDRCRRRS